MQQAVPDKGPGSRIFPGSRLCSDRNLEQQGGLLRNKLAGE